MEGLVRRHSKFAAPQPDPFVFSHNRALIPWADQEIEEFHRLEIVLRRAGVNSEFEHNCADEGDPWCVVCRQGSGAVLAHFARIDDIYIADWVGLSQVLRANQLREAIDRFLEVVLHSGRRQARCQHRH
jgi:hypothetical protein